MCNLLPTTFFPKQLQRLGVVILHPLEPFTIRRTGLSVHPNHSSQSETQKSLLACETCGHQWHALHPPMFPMQCFTFPLRPPLTISCHLCGSPLGITQSPLTLCAAHYCTSSSLPPLSICLMSHFVDPMLLNQLTHCLHHIKKNILNVCVTLIRSWWSSVIGVCTGDWSGYSNTRIISYPNKCLYKKNRTNIVLDF